MIAPVLGRRGRDNPSLGLRVGLALGGLWGRPDAFLGQGGMGRTTGPGHNLQEVATPRQDWREDAREPP
ncbi:MAG: hypothetical protein JWO21_1625 [Solirubrobacterales bacterium]|jgi:hypothetical protein|nr:hypothetical protein [Solirubrobacterales bacterium]